MVTFIWKYNEAYMDYSKPEELLMTSYANALRTTKDDFGVKYIGQENINHLISVLKCYYTVKIDMTGG
eukprot:15329205-Ditylum_brightwellii.AAC.2